MFDVRRVVKKLVTPLRQYVGRLSVIDRHLRVASGPLTQVLGHGHPSLPQQESQVTGMNHAEVAAFVLRHWNVSEEVVEPIECQFDATRSTHHRAMTILLGEARALATEIVATLPPIGSTAPAGDTACSGDQWTQAIIGQIREIEGWWR